MVLMAMWGCLVPARHRWVIIIIIFPLYIPDPPGDLSRRSDHQVFAIVYFSFLYGLLRLVRNIQIFICTWRYFSTLFLQCDYVWWLLGKGPNLVRTVTSPVNAGHFFGQDRRTIIVFGHQHRLGSCESPIGVACVVLIGLCNAHVVQPRQCADCVV